MYAIIKDGGKNYKVVPGKVIEVEKKKIDPGSEISFSEVLYYQSEEEILVGTPTLKQVAVKGTVEGDFKAQKVDVFKFKRRKKYRKRRGHRQTYTKVRIREISKE